MPAASDRRQICAPQKARWAGLCLEIEAILHVVGRDLLPVLEKAALPVSCWKALGCVYVGNLHRRAQFPIDFGDGRLLALLGNRFRYTSE